MEDAIDCEKKKEDRKMSAFRFSKRVQAGFWKGLIGLNGGCSHDMELGQGTSQVNSRTMIYTDSRSLQQ